MVFNGGAVLAEVMASNDAYWVTKAEWWVLASCGLHSCVLMSLTYLSVLVFAACRDEQGVRALDKLAPRTA